MDVRGFKEESSNTIIYCFCTGLETVENAVVNPEVEVAQSWVLSNCQEQLGLAVQRRRLALPTLLAECESTHFFCLGEKVLL